MPSASDANTGGILKVDWLTASSNGRGPMNDKLPSQIAREHFSNPHRSASLINYTGPYRIHYKFLNNVKFKCRIVCEVVHNTYNHKVKILSGYLNDDRRSKYRHESSRLINKWWKLKWVYKLPLYRSQHFTHKSKQLNKYLYIFMRSQLEI